MYNPFFSSLPHDDAFKFKNAVHYRNILFTHFLAKNQQIAHFLHKILPNDC